MHGLFKNIDLPKFTMEISYDIDPPASYPITSDIGEVKENYNFSYSTKLLQKTAIQGSILSKTVTYQSNEGEPNKFKTSNIT